MSDNPQRLQYPLKRERATFEQPTGPKILNFDVELSCQRTHPIAFPMKGWNQAQISASQALVPYTQNPNPIPQGCPHPIGISCYFPGCPTCQPAPPIQPTINILPMLLVPVVPLHPLASVTPCHQVSSADWQKVIEHCRLNPVYNSPLGNAGLSALLDPKGAMKFPQRVGKVPRDKIVFWQEIIRQKTGIRGSKSQWSRLPEAEKAIFYKRWREVKSEAKWQRDQKLTEAF